MSQRIRAQTELGRKLERWAKLRGPVGALARRLLGNRSCDVAVNSAAAPYGIVPTYDLAAMVTHVQEGMSCHILVTSVLARIGQTSLAMTFDGATWRVRHSEAFASFDVTFEATFESPPGSDPRIGLSPVAHVTMMPDAYPGVSMSPSSLGFVGEDVPFPDQTVTIRNGTNDMVRILQCEIIASGFAPNPSAFQIVTVSPPVSVFIPIPGLEGPMNPGILPLQTGEVVVRFARPFDGMATATLLIRTSDAAMPSFEIPLTGMLVEAF